MKKILIVGLSILFSNFYGSYLFAQLPSNPVWIAGKDPNSSSFGVYHFRKTFSLDILPESLEVFISADNRYKFFINGKKVAYGPAKGDLRTYKVDRIDISSFLRPGQNTIAVLVFNAGQDKPMAFISHQTAFLFHAQTPEFSFLNSSNDWKVLKNDAYLPITYDRLKTWEWVKGYYACGPGDELFTEKYPWGWEASEYNDSEWENAVELQFEKDPPWKLFERNIAFMDNFPELPVRLRRIQGMDILPPSPGEAMVVPPGTHARILYDFGVFTMGYPKIVFSGGEGATVKIRYAEALYEEPNLKAHRDSVGDLSMFGVFDIIHTDGSDNRAFEPLWKRAFRYLELEVSTEDEPLTFSAPLNGFSGYPYPDPADFFTNDERLNDIFRMSFQTFRMCSGETYYDTPYYEQMSYGGDNRPIGAVSFYNTSDDRLYREVMRIYTQSANADTKLFAAAYPSRFGTSMGTWSLAWIQSLYDYYTIRGDTSFVRQFTDHIDNILNFYRRNLDENMGMLGEIVNRSFIDWSHKYGNVPQRRPGLAITHSAMLTLYFVHSLDCASEIYRVLGDNEKADSLKSLSTDIGKSTYKHCWDENKNLLADYPDKSSFSQQTNTLAVLCNLFPEDREEMMVRRIFNVSGFDEIASSYFSFFLFKMLEKTSQEELFLQNLDFWETYLDKGHTTCGETGFASHDRSDCHAWSAHPAYFLLRYTAGIRPLDAGFKRVMISPETGSLNNISASIPHPRGRISVDYKITDRSMSAVVVLPEGMEGIFKFQGEIKELKPGKNTFRIKL